MEATFAKPAGHELEYGHAVGRRGWRKTDISNGVGVAVAANRLVLGGGDVCVLHGLSLTETTGASTATVRLRDGNSAAAEILVRIDLLAGQGTRETFGHQGIIVATGRIFLEVVTGTVEGVLYWA